MVLDRGDKVSHCHREPAVARDAEDRAIGIRNLRCKGAGEPEAHGGKVAGHGKALVFHPEVPPKPPLVLPDIKRDDGIVRDDLGEHLHDERRAQGGCATVGLAVTLFVPVMLHPCKSPPCRALLFLCKQREEVREDLDAVAPEAECHGVPAELQGINVHLDHRFVHGDIGILREPDPEHHQQVRFPGQFPGRGRPDIPEDPDDPFVVFGDDPLCPEGGEDGCGGLFCDRKNVLPGGIRAPAGKDDRALRRIDPPGSFPEEPVGREDIHAADAGLPGAEPCIQRRFLDRVRYRELGNAPLKDRMLQRTGEQEDCRLRVRNGIVINRDRTEEGILVDLLDPPGPGILDPRLAVQGDHRCVIFLSVVEPGSKVGSPRAGDG